MTNTELATATDNASGDLEESRFFTPRFDAAGVLPAVVTDAQSGELLMLAYMNEEALALTIETGEAHFWSRSRRRLWRKGETSGNVLRVVEMRTDCDQDTIWLRVRMEGAGACCHTGRRSCFYRIITADTGSAAAQLAHADGERLFDPARIYGAGKRD